MSIETELKLRITPEDMRRLKRHPFLRSLSLQRAYNQPLYSIYYDTPTLTLIQHKMALRLRRVGKQWIQTLKGGGKISGGLHQRNEWEAPVPSEALDFEVLKATGGQLPKGVKPHLQAVFVTDFTRHTRLIDFEGAQIELGMDSGEIRAGKKRHPLSEIELELKSGTPDKLFKLAQALLEIVPLQIETTNKAEYGYRLFSPAFPLAKKPHLPTLDLNQAVNTTLPELISASFAQVQFQVAAVLAEGDEEAIHQTRVSLRRLRVLFGVAKQWRTGPDSEYFNQQFKLLHAILGKLREWDVFINQTLVAAVKHIDVTTLLKASEQERKSQSILARQHLSSIEIQRTYLAVGSWLHQLPTETESDSMRHFLRHTLKKQLKCVVSSGEKAASQNEHDLHALRIACKKLRYTLEIIGIAQHASLVKALSNMQERLGRLNDLSVAHRLLDSLQTRSRSTAIRQLRNVIEQDRAQIVAKFDGDWKLMRRALRKFSPEIGEG
ncbi:MAG: CYTH and CHAD domain-containing protein [Sideroxydans sp.]|nr:CYTH and CHAD domain-containing protein [Sideroxydans sp.]